MLASAAQRSPAQALPWRLFRCNPVLPPLRDLDGAAEGPLGPGYTSPRRSRSVVLRLRTHLDGEAATSGIGGPPAGRTDRRPARRLPQADFHGHASDETFLSCRTSAPGHAFRVELANVHGRGALRFPNSWGRRYRLRRGHLVVLGPPAADAGSAHERLIPREGLLKPARSRPCAGSSPSDWTVRNEPRHSESSSGAPRPSGGRAQRGDVSPPRRAVAA